MVDDIDDLAAVLFDLDLNGLATAATTAEITRAIVRWAVARGWPVRTEARVGLRVDADVDPRRGFIDAIVRRGNSRPDLANRDRQHGQEVVVDEAASRCGCRYGRCLDSLGR